MKKLFTLIAAVAMTLGANAQTGICRLMADAQLAFANSAVTAESFTDGTLSSNGFKLEYVSGGKMSVAANNSDLIFYAGDATKVCQYDNIGKAEAVGRLSTGSVNGTTTKMTFTVPSDGYIAVATYSGEANRTMTFKQNDAEIGTYTPNTDKVTFTDSKISSKSGYPYVIVPVKAGTVDMTTQGSLYVYEFLFFANSTSRMTGSELFSAGTTSITAKTSVMNFTLYPKDPTSTDGDVAVDESSVKTMKPSTGMTGGYSGCGRYKSAGAMAEGARTIEFYVAGNSTIKIATSSSSGSDKRKLELYKKGSTEAVATLVESLGSAAAYYEYNYTGEAATLYLVSDGGCNTYFVSATNTATDPTAINEVNAAAAKSNGVVKTANYIIKGGKKYNYAGQLVK